MKKEVAEKLQKIINESGDIKISELLFEVLDDKTYITAKIELIKGIKNVPQQ